MCFEIHFKHSIKTNRLRLLKAGKKFLQIQHVSDSCFPVFANTQIEKSGVYRMCAQFKIDGKVHTADFSVDVTEGKRRKRRKVARSSTIKSLILDVK